MGFGKHKKFQKFLVAFSPGFFCLLAQYQVFEISNLDFYLNADLLVIVPKMPNFLTSIFGEGTA